MIYKTEILSLLMKSSVLLISMEQTLDDVFRKLGYSLLGQNQVTGLLRWNVRCYELLMCCRFECWNCFNSNQMCTIVELLLVWNYCKLWCGNHVSRLASLIESVAFMLYNASSSSCVECMTKNTMAMILERGIQALLEVQAILSSWHDLILTIN